MSATDGAYANLSVSKTLFVNDMIVKGKLSIDLNEVHDHNSGVFVSRLKGSDFEYVLDVHPSGEYVELYKQSNTNPSLASRIGDKTRESTRFTNMHYEHAIADCFCFRFMSDKNRVLLVEVNDDLKGVFLYKTSRSLKEEHPK